jgi:hypothetical protein
MAGMEAHPLPSVWRACIGFALSQIALAVLMLALSAADPKVSSLDLRGSIEPPLALGAPSAFEGH